MKTQKNTPQKITFSSTETVRIDDATVKRLLAEGMEFRRSIERSADRMFAVSSSQSSIKMR